VFAKAMELNGGGGGSLCSLDLSSNHLSGLFEHRGTPGGAYSPSTAVLLLRAACACPRLNRLRMAHNGLGRAAPEEVRPVLTAALQATRALWQLHVELGGNAFGPEVRKAIPPQAAIRL
jgi:Ran GTPase-activating protein (RanGAP) involved in mRNA processing and transport